MTRAGVERAAWVCLRCGRPAHRVLWLVDQRRHVHAARTQPGPGGTPSCCGGEVVHPEEAHLDPARPGVVMPCMPSWGSLAIHLVRLGQPVGIANGSWQGSALCGRSYRSRYWVPVGRPIEPGGCCAECAAVAERTRALP